MQPNTVEKINLTLIQHHGSTHKYNSSTPSPLNPPLNPNTNATTATAATNNGVRSEIIDGTIARATSNATDNMSDFEWDSEYPPGYRFCPRDGELIYYYLERRILNLGLPHDKIKDVDIYATTPDKLSEEYEPVGENEWYFFTPRDRKYRNGLRPNRATNRTKGGVSFGYWKATGADKDITHPLDESKVIGHKKALVFYEGKSPKGLKTNWIMHEFRVKKPSNKRKRLHDDDMRLDDFVLCKIYHKNEKSPTPPTRSKTTNEPNPSPNNQEPETKMEPEDENFPPEEDHLIYNPSFIGQDTHGLFEDTNLQYFFNNVINNYVIHKNELDCIVKKDYCPELQVPDLPYSFSDIPLIETKPTYDDFYSTDYRQLFEDPEKKPLLPCMNPILQGGPSSEHNYDSIFFDGEQFKFKFIASPNNPSGSE